MKLVFTGALVLLLGASAALRLSFPDADSDIPILYWATGWSSSRAEQMQLFHQWQKGRGNAPVDLRVDQANRGMEKYLIQSVSGVGTDIMDVLTSKGEISFLDEVGALEDLTEPAGRLGFDSSRTFPALKPALEIKGRQVAFPCNVDVALFVVNRDAFARHGQPLPPSRWSFGEFEERGKAFVSAANLPGQRQTVFYAYDFPLQVMYHSLGLSAFNETLTHCALDDARFIRCLVLKKKWIYEDHLLPDAAEQQAFTTGGAGTLAAINIFHSGNYAMMPISRWVVKFTRNLNPLALGAVELPNGGFPNVTMNTRAAVVYKGSHHPERAHEFLAFLASPDYNLQVVRDGDALPPDPAFLDTEEFLRPPGYPQEWELHRSFRDAARSIAIPPVVSPYILTNTVNRLVEDAADAALNGIISPEEAASKAAQRINDTIAQGLRDNPKLRPGFERESRLQKQIDALLAAGQPVPANWVLNPFYLRYYQTVGKLAPDQPLP